MHAWLTNVRASLQAGSYQPMADKRWVEIWSPLTRLKRAKVTLQSGDAELARERDRCGDVLGRTLMFETFSKGR